MCSLHHPLRKDESSFQRRIDHFEIGLRSRARTVHRTDDGKCNTGDDQTILNGGRPRLIRQELREETPQNYLLSRLALLLTSAV